MVFGEMLISLKKKTFWKVSFCAGKSFPSVCLTFCTFLASNKICGLKFPMRVPVLAVKDLFSSTDPHIPLRAALGYW